MFRQAKFGTDRRNLGQICEIWDSDTTTFGIVAACNIGDIGDIGQTTTFGIVAAVNKICSVTDE